MKIKDTNASLSFTARGKCVGEYCVCIRWKIKQVWLFFFFDLITQTEYNDVKYEAVGNSQLLFLLFWLLLFLRYNRLSVSLLRCFCMCHWRHDCRCPQSSIKMAIIDMLRLWWLGNIWFITLIFNVLWLYVKKNQKVCQYQKKCISLNPKIKTTIIWHNKREIN